jgi:hypothetical protein
MPLFFGQWLLSVILARAERSEPDVFDLELFWLEVELGGLEAAAVTR